MYTILQFILIYYSHDILIYCSNGATQIDQLYRYLIDQFTSLFAKITKKNTKHNSLLDYVSLVLKE